MPFSTSSKKEKANLQTLEAQFQTLPKWTWPTASSPSVLIDTSRTTILSPPLALFTSWSRHSLPSCLSSPKSSGKSNINSDKVNLYFIPGLNIFGASHGAYWISWFVVALIYSVVGSIATLIAGLIFGFGFFLETNAGYILFALFIPFTLAMQMFSFFLSTLAPTLKAANAVSYGIVLFAIVVESFVSDNNLLKFLFASDPSPLVEFLQVFLLFYPPFSYTKVPFN